MIRNQSSFLDEPELREIWKKYQLSVGAWLYSLLTVFVFFVLIRNSSHDFPVQGLPGLFLLFLLSAICSIFFKDNFQTMSRICVLAFVPGVINFYLQWPQSAPPPVLIHFIYIPLIVMFLDNLLSAAAYILLTLLLLAYTTYSVDLDPHDSMQMVIVCTVSSLMIFGGALVLWYTLIKLFRRHEFIRQKLHTSLNLRKNLFIELTSSISQPLNSLSVELAKAEINWQTIVQQSERLDRLFQSVRQEAVKTTYIHDNSLDSLMSRLNSIGYRAWQFLLLSGLAVTVLISLYQLIITDKPDILMICAAVLCGAVYFIDNKIRIKHSIRHIIVISLMFLILWSSLTHLENEGHMYQIMYGSVLVLFSAIILNMRSTLFLISLTLGAILYWYVKVPEPEYLAAITRSNILISGLLISTIAVVSRIYLNISLSNLVSSEKQLLVETDKRYRLLATLYQDLVNPLQVITGIARQRASNTENKNDGPTLAAMLEKIQQLLALAQTDNNSMQNSYEMQLSNVHLHSVLDEIALLFDRQLKDKQLSLQLDHCSSQVIADPVRLSLSVLSSLMTKAIKVSPPGSVIRIITEKTDDEHLRISIRDGGKGIPEENVSRPDNAEYAGSQPGTADEIGGDQGLRLAGQYVRQMNGMLKLDSIAGVSVILPLAV